MLAARCSCPWVAVVALVSVCGGCAGTVGDDSAAGGSGGAGSESCDTEGTVEQCYPGEPASRGIGQCADGSRTCAGGRWGACDGYRLPEDEICDDLLDNDCDGITDEQCPCEPGSSRACYTGPSATRGLGACTDGTQQCASGSWSLECSGEVVPSTEGCEGRDDDCDGIVDEGCTCLDGDTEPCYTGPNGTDGVGECRGGHLVCQSGVWQGACIGEQAPTAESCNSADDNCDGQIDEGNPGGGAACATGLPGACAQGVIACSNGSLGCQSSTPPGDPACAPCIGCLNGYADCNQACQQSQGCPGGSCAIPNSTDPGACCGCLPPLDCSGCLSPYADCDQACQQVAGAAGGFCAYDHSTDPGACCGCFW